MERGRDVIIFPFSTAIKESQVKKFTELSIVKKKEKKKRKGLRKVHVQGRRMLMTS